MRTRTTTTRAPELRCDCCGVSVPPGPFAAPLRESAWSRCETCRTATPTDLLAAALARAGVEHAPDDPVTVTGMRRVAWKARPAERARARAAAERAAGPQGRLPADAYGREVEQALSSLDTVGFPSAEPWAHLDPREVRREVRVARDALARARQLKTCTDGPCGVCGVRTSPAWWGPRSFGAGVGLDTRPASRWPVCDTCQPHLEAAGEDPASERARRRWTAIVLDAPADPPSLSVPALVMPYAVYTGREVAPVDAEGTEQAWAWVPDADRARLAALCPQHRPRAQRDRDARVADARARLDASRRAVQPRSALVSGETR